MRPLILLAACLLFTTACSKKETPPSNGQTPTGNKTPSELLTGTWSLISGIYTRPSLPDSNIIADCMKDNTTIFNSNGIYFEYENAIKCDPTEPDRRKGDWKIDGQYLILKDSSNFTNYADTFDIKQLDETTLKYSSEYNNDGNLITITWKKK